jgi:membrane protein implicated in regulation of membrane protease activity
VNGAAVVLKFTAAAALAAAAGLCVVAGGWALYSALTDGANLTPASAAALVALAAGLLALLGGWLVFRTVEEDELDDGSEGLVGRAVDLVRDRPVMAAAAAVAAGWIFVRNPALATLVATALTDRSRRRRTG